MASSAKFAWGISESGVLQHIGTVPSGLACRCFCLDCANPLIAHKGRIKAAHFQHAVTTDCLGESVLHKAAKQILVDASTNGLSLDTSESRGELIREDITGQIHRRDWYVAAQRIPLNSVSLEARLADDLIADAVVRVSSSHPLAVEIYVTNQKDEEAETKYRELAHDALEIDLSSERWDIGPELLQQRVLENAPRRWLYSNAAAAARDEVDVELLAEIHRANEKFDARFDAAIAYICDNNLLSSPTFPWPTLSSIAYITRPPRQGEYYERHQPVEAKQRPRFSRLNNDWERAEASCACSGKVNGRTNASIKFVIAKPSGTHRAWSGPTLIIPIDVENLDSNFVSTLKPYWVGIEKWEAKLLERVEEKRDAKIAAERSQAEQKRRWRLAFSQLTPKQQLESITGKWMKVEGPPSVGKFAPAWNTTFHVWKSAIWHINIASLFSGRSDFVSVKHLARSDYYTELLGCSADEDAVAQRSRNLWYWFRELESLGILAHTGRQFFEADMKPPADFRPWHWIGNTKSRR
ncbi:competence protein CoiA family protein [Salinisphaera sp. T5B8]